MLVPRHMPRAKGSLSTSEMPQSAYTLYRHVSHRCPMNRLWPLMPSIMKPPSRCVRRGGGLPKLWPQHAKSMDLACLRRGRKMPYTCTSNGASATPTAGSGFEQLQGHALTMHEAPEPKVILFDDDLPAFVYQSEAGMNPGDGRFSLHGLARGNSQVAHPHSGLRALLLGLPQKGRPS